MYKVGNRVEVDFGGTWYGGVIKSIVGIDHCIDFDDGTREEDVRLHEMRLTISGAREAPSSKRARFDADSAVTDEEEESAVDAEYDASALRATCTEGDHLLARDAKGIWCEAKVLEVREEEARRVLLVHFVGWNAKFDEWLESSSERLRPLPWEERLEVGECVIARDAKGIWAEARVLDSRGTRRRELLVHFLGWGPRWDIWITPGTGQLRRLPWEQRLRQNDKVLACDSKGNWAEARVVDVREVKARPREPKAGLPKQLKVHFDGFGPRYDEWIAVGSGRLRRSSLPPALKQRKPRLSKVPSPPTSALDPASALAPVSALAPAVVPPVESSSALEPNRPRVAVTAAAVTDAGDFMRERTAVAAQRLLLLAEQPAERAGDLAENATGQPGEGACSISTSLPDDKSLLQSTSLPQARAPTTATGCGGAGPGVSTVPSSHVTDGIATLRRQLECPICERIFERPFVLPCQHAFCERCISNIMKATSPTSQCILCCVPFFRRNVVASPVLSGVVAAFHQMTKK